MFLAHCIEECEDDLICDFAETYHIYDYKEYSPKYIGILCAGLRNNSRIKMKLTESEVPLSEILLARMVDELSFLAWTKTKDGAKNRNRPKSVLRSLTEKKKEEVQAFKTAEEFHAAWNDIIARSKNG